VPWAIIAIVWVAYAIPPYLSLDPDQARIPGLRDSLPLHYPLLWAHVMFGSVAMLTASVQIWPWLRQHHLAVHRNNGRVYVFAGVLPAGLTAVAITPFSFAPPGNAVAAVLWLAVTLVGYRMIRKRRYAEHRRWMTYSFALTFSILWGRLMFFVLPRLPTWDEGHVPLVLETATWLGWVVNLLIAQWWLERTSGKVSLPT
jgi:uncharacterized membrane protein YozB (DUF420 family)